VQRDARPDSRTAARSSRRIEQRDEMTVRRSIVAGLVVRRAGAPCRQVDATVRTPSAGEWPPQRRCR
jgi:hypothetical protein